MDYNAVCKTWISLVILFFFSSSLTDLYRRNSLTLRKSWCKMTLAKGCLSFICGSAMELLLGYTVSWSLVFMHRLRLKTVLAAKVFPMGVLGAFSWTSFAGLAISQQISSQCLYILLDNDKKHFSIQQLIGTLIKYHCQHTTLNRLGRNV